jgi:Zn-dependent protease
VGGALTDTVAETRPTARKPSPVGLAIVVLWLLLGAALLFVAHPPHVLTFAFVMVGWMLSVMLHEFGHASVAWLAGDHTVKTRGYLDFDPRRYADPVTSIGFPLLALALGGIGFPGGAVYLRPDLMRGRLWRAASALAGPAATAVILLVLALILRLWVNVGAEGDLYPALSVLAFLQAMALILNLLPLPGLDGFNALRPFLPKAVTLGLRKVERPIGWLVLAAVFFSPEIGGALFRQAAELSVALGLLPDAIDDGLAAFHFWR